jgi:hypothetical protein
MGVDAQCETRVGVSELCHDGRRVLAAHVGDGGEGWRSLCAVTRGATAVAAFGEQLVGALDPTARTTRSRALSLSRGVPLEVGKTRSSGFASGSLARWAVSSSCSAGTMLTIRSPASVFDLRTVIWPAAQTLEEVDHRRCGGNDCRGHRRNQKARPPPWA